MDFEQTVKISMLAVGILIVIGIAYSLEEQRKSDESRERWRKEREEREGESKADRALFERMKTQMKKMPLQGELGECPTCSKSISLNARICLHCGENHFVDRVFHPKDKCRFCSGSGELKVWEDGRETLKLCSVCEGTGKKILGRIDKRIYKQ